MVLRCKFADVLNGRIEDLRVVIHCDAGSIETIEKSKSQIGVVAMAQSKDPKVIYPSDNFRIPDLKGARKQVRNHPYVKSVPIFWTSGKSERVAISSFAAELQAIYCAFDTGTVLRQLYSELICGHSAGYIPVEIRNDQISVANALNGMSAIPTDGKLAGTMRCIREMLEKSEISSLTYVQGQLNMADALTKSTSGNELFYLLINNKCAAATIEKVRDKLKSTASGKQYLMLQDLKTRNFRKEHSQRGECTRDE